MFVGSSKAEASTSEIDRDGSCLGSREDGKSDRSSLQQPVAHDSDSSKALVVGCGDRDIRPSDRLGELLAGLRRNVKVSWSVAGRQEPREGKGKTYRSKLREKVRHCVSDTKFVCAPVDADGDGDAGGGVEERSEEGGGKKHVE